MSEQDKAADRAAGQQAVLGQVERMRTSDVFDEAIITSMSAEDKALFEVAVIDALTNWPCNEQNRLRATLIDLGYDEQCYRRLMRGCISDHVRASTLLSLLRQKGQIDSAERGGN